MPMGLPKAATATTALFESLLPKSPGVEAKKLFGQPAAFVNGNLFFGVFGDQMFVRLSEKDRAQAASSSGFVPFEPMPGRPMREYLVLPARVRANPVESRRWVGRSLAHVASLPTKRPKRQR
jgi:TfoX/Sxy family transcriptional regulator of competence genes